MCPYKISKYGYQKNLALAIMIMEYIYNKKRKIREKYSKNSTTSYS